MKAALVDFCPLHIHPSLAKRWLLVLSPAG